MSGAQKGTVVASGVVQLGLLAAALLDIYRRPAGRYRATNGCGPRRRSSTTSALSLTSCSDVGASVLLCCRRRRAYHLVMIMDSAIYVDGHRDESHPLEEIQE